MKQLINFVEENQLRFGGVAVSEILKACDFWKIISVIFFKKNNRRRWQSCNPSNLI